MHLEKKEREESPQRESVGQRMILKKALVLKTDFSPPVKFPPYIFLFPFSFILLRLNTGGRIFAVVTCVGLLLTNGFVTRLTGQEF